MYWIYTTYTDSAAAYSTVFKADTLTIQVSAKIILQSVDLLNSEIFICSDHRSTLPVKTKTLDDVAVLVPLTLTLVWLPGYHGIL